MITWLTTAAARIGWRRLATWAAAVAAVLAIEALLHDPFGWRRAKLARLEQAAARAEADASARSLEVSAERESAVRVKALADAQSRTRVATEVLMREAAAAADADEPLEPARLARLKAHDAAICAQVKLTGCDGAER